MLTAVENGARCPCCRPINRRFEPQSGRRNEGLGIGTEKRMKIHSAIDAGKGRVIKMASVTSRDLGSRLNPSGEPANVTIAAERTMAGRRPIR